MAKSRQVTIQFLGDAKGLISAANSGGKATTTLGDKLKRVGKAAVIGFAGAAVVAGKAMYDMAEAAIEDEKSAALLANTLKNTTGATKTQVAAVEDWISKQGELYGVTDDDLRPALAKLAAATGSITKSQKLASLAMDVSAGTGKDLSSITLALAKAQTGSLAGLGRMGIATKDAAGKTRTLADVTEELTKKYAGSAAKAADTASGKFQRLKVDLSETAEAIGYKLLPYANDLGDWLLKTGVPAAEDFAHSFKQELGPVLKDAKTWVSDNKDELHDLGTEVVNEVVPAIRDLGGFVGDAVKFFAQLPPPVKATTIELGLAAVAVTKVSNAMGGMNLSLGAGQTKLAGWRRALVLAAGIGGLGGIAEGARTGSKSVSILGDALTGAFVGGTLGSAVPLIGTGIGAVAGAAAGAGVGLIQMQKAADKAGDSSKDATPNVEGLAASLDQLTGATTAATRAQILHNLETTHAIDAGAELGLTQRDLINSALGQKAAYEKVRTAVRNATLSSNEVMDSTGHLTRTNKKAYDAAVTLTGSIDSLGSSLTDAKADVIAQAIAAENMSSIYKNFPKNVATQIDAIGIVPTAKGVADLAVKYNAVDKRHITALIKATGTDISVRQVQGLIDKLNALHDQTVRVNTVLTTTHGKPIPVPGGASPRTMAGGAGMGNVIQGNFGGKGGYGNALLGSFNPRAAEVAGNALLNGIVKGIKKGERTLHNVMEGLHNYIQNKTDNLQALLDDRSGFIDSFRSAFTESIFSAQNTDAEGNSVAPTLASMKQFAQQQQANAHALAGNIQSLLSKGLSRDLISQLVAQGSSGVQQIAALATGTAQDVADFNAVNTDINNTLNGLGKDLFDALNPNAQSQIDLLNKQIAQGDASIAALNKIADKLDKGDKIEIKGSTLVILLRALERETGRKYLASSA